MPIIINGTGLAGSPGPLHIAVGLYAVNDRAALSLIESKTGDLYETFTSNVPSETLADNEVVVGLWRLPMSTVVALLDSDCFEPVRTLAVGNARGAVWRITSIDLLQAIHDAKTAVLA
ncbi:hypothetical protein [Cupriavidus pauculus]|mgnify:CR=1 FL=1|uniref:hypothetical protein n=1 Tax=Cupriavidus pauculus TaxID=82633 RepID=UPI001244340A|nr:hypothetical protein [Cupriavidus pauculus]KAB0599716.1 hypothetical protein F7R19_24530 [Cupriavidus pauculus]MBY4733511.1 hypothetical protein [Cupriavidus pauculus]UAL03752.1 hypothetical protein K8O84_28765 [Cupriavidus pauculus]